METQNKNTGDTAKELYQEHKAISQDVNTFDALATEWEDKYLQTKKEIDDEQKKSKRKRRGENWLRMSMLMESNQMSDAMRYADSRFLAKRKYDKNVEDARSDVKENLDSYIEDAREDARKNGVEVNLDK